MSSATKWGIALMLIGAAISLWGTTLDKRAALIIGVVLFLAGIMILLPWPFKRAHQELVEEMKVKIRDIQNKRRSTSRGGVVDLIIPSADDNHNIFREAMRQIEKEDRRK